ncbi:MAG: hypothetical protein ACD_23C00424G0002 [uncultured bacterium]|nr:MAG: hypothetical protein ACD_23C00424G0002 [uncultured bacterium]
MVVGRAALGFKVVQPDGELVAGADAPGKRGRNAALVLLGAVVVGFLHHGIQAKRRVFAGDKIEVARGTVVIAGTEGVCRLMLVNQQGGLVHLVDHAAGGSLAKEHGSRALEHFHAVLVEGVAFDQRRVFQAVDVDVTGLAQRKAAQAHVFLAGFARQEGHARCGAQHFAEVVLVAVIHELFGEHRHGLGDVLDVLLALADGGFLEEQGVFALNLCRFLDGHGGHGGLRGAALGRGAHRGGQHQGTQGQQGLVRRHAERGCTRMDSGKSGCAQRGAALQGA